MSLLFQIDQQLILNHMKEPTPQTLYTRDAFQLAKRALETSDMAVHNAALGALTFALAVIVAEHVDPEVFIANFLEKFRGDVAAMKQLAHDYVEDVSPKDGDTIQ